LLKAFQNRPNWPRLAVKSGGRWADGFSKIQLFIQNIFGGLKTSEIGPEINP
jgi:hypothetical protein